MIKEQNFEKNSLFARFACLKKKVDYTDKILRKEDENGKNHFQKN